MRKGPLLLTLTALLALAAGYGAARWRDGSLLRSIAPVRLPWAPRQADGGAAPVEPAAGPTDTAAATPIAAVSEPVYVADTWQEAARAIDATASLPMNRALVGLARRYLGRPYNAYSLDRTPQERLVLDLTRFDCFLFVEQLLALVNSHEVATQTEGVETFTDHVRRLRYQGGRVDYCRRHHYFTRWAEEAERQGYLVNITRFLPGAVSRQRPLTFLSSHASSYEPMSQPRNRECITALEKKLVVNQAYIPMARLQEALPSLRDGDIFALVTREEGLDVTHVGLVELGESGVDAIHAAPGAGVTRSLDLAAYAAKVKDVIGVMVLRPIPNQDGEPGTPPESRS
jgi:hypothetical protein